MTEDRRLRPVRTADGRQLAVAEWGDPDGVPVLALHGTPGSRLGRTPLQDELRAAGLRVVTYDRPGYGRSDRHPGRRVVDCAGDVEAIADALGLDRFVVSGGSGGGPHSLAVAARLGERVRRAACVVGIAPYDAEDLDFFVGMDPGNVTEFGWALEGEEVLARELRREADGFLAQVERDPAGLLDAFEMSEADRAVLADPRTAQIVREDVRECFATGVWGWVDDDLALTRPWGFELGEIAVPVVVRYGVQDVLVPAAHGAWLAERLPGAEVRVDTGAGHLATPEVGLAELVALVEGAPA